MNLARVNIRNLKHLVPPWAINTFDLAGGLNDQFKRPEAQELLARHKSVFERLSFWIEVEAHRDPITIRFAEPDETMDMSGALVINCDPQVGDTAQVRVHLNPILPGYPRIDKLYTVYSHTIMTETPLSYIGITGKPWFKRFQEHLAAARRGSRLLFHQALAQHPTLAYGHRVLLCELTRSQALEHEERLVSKMSLYPMGLNMIPGGNAGLAYLHKLGLNARTEAEIDRALRTLAERETVAGMPNPLCAARWAADPDFVERVICGHSGRLTVQQVKQARLLATMDFGVESISARIGSTDPAQVQRLLRGRTYRRIK